MPSVSQMHTLLSLPYNCGTNPVWSDWSWSTETPYPGVLSVSLLMDPDFLPLVLNFLLLAVPNIHDAQRGTSSFKYRNIYGRTPSFASLNMDLGCRQDNLLCQYLNYCFTFCLKFLSCCLSPFPIPLLAFSCQCRGTEKMEPPCEGLDWKR